MCLLLYHVVLSALIPDTLNHNQDDMGDTFDRLDFVIFIASLVGVMVIGLVAGRRQAPAGSGYSHRDIELDRSRQIA